MACNIFGGRKRKERGKKRKDGAKRHHFAMFQPATSRETDGTRNEERKTKSTYMCLPLAHLLACRNCGSSSQNCSGLRWAGSWFDAIFARRIGPNWGQKLSVLVSRSLEAPIGCCSKISTPRFICCQHHGAALAPARYPAAPARLSAYGAAAGKTACAFARGRRDLMLSSQVLTAYSMRHGLHAGERTLSIGRLLEATTFNL